MRLLLLFLLPLVNADYALNSGGGYDGFPCYGTNSTGVFELSNVPVGPWLTMQSCLGECYVLYPSYSNITCCPPSSGSLGLCEVYSSPESGPAYEVVEWMLAVGACLMVVLIVAISVCAK